MQSNNIQLAIFDMAGTTVHDENFVTKSLCNSLAQFGFEAISLEAANKVMGIAKPEAIKSLIAEFYPSMVDEAPVKDIHISFLETMKDFYRHSPDIKEIEGATETFKLLKSRGIKVGLDTGFSRDITDIIIERLDWNRPEILDISIASDEVINGRPEPDMIFMAMEKLSISNVKNVAKIGDTPVDLLEGSNAECSLVIGVLSGTGDKATLEQYPHTYLVDSILDVPEMIDLFQGVVA
jgi:phosphonatase-like hydrolase